MEVSQAVIPRSDGKTSKTDEIHHSRQPSQIATADLADHDVFWDAHWTLDDDDQSESPLVLL
jgi:hypothetical protein